MFRVHLRKQNVLIVSCIMNSIHLFLIIFLDLATGNPLKITEARFKCETILKKLRKLSPNLQESISKWRANNIDRQMKQP